jgi:hypothetical protein
LYLYAASYNTALFLGCGLSGEYNFIIVTFLLTYRRELVKSEVSLFRHVAFLSVAVGSLLLAYQMGKDQRRTDTLHISPQSQPNLIALKEGQTIVAVVDRPTSMHFYVGNDEVESSNDA